jgi:hypothetical protein
MNTTPSVFGPSVFGASRFGPGATVDHLVVIAHTLDQGVAWCEQTLGITPGPGGKHPLFGTHNRLFKIATPPSSARTSRSSPSTTMPVTKTDAWASVGSTWTTSACNRW